MVYLPALAVKLVIQEEHVIGKVVLTANASVTLLKSTCFVETTLLLHENHGVKCMIMQVVFW